MPQRENINGLLTNAVSTLKRLAEPEPESQAPTKSKHDIFGQ